MKYAKLINGQLQLAPRHYISVKVTQQGIVKADLVPCYRKADTVFGVYDIATRTFFAASGTWAKGADVT